MSQRINYADPLPGVPRVESPFFADFFDTDHPDYAVAHALSTRGYAIIDFPDEDISEVADRLRHDLSEHFRTIGGRRVQDAWTFNADVRRVACNQRILELLGWLYGRPAFPFQTLNFPVGTQQHYHSDSIHFSSLPERYMCGVWVALEDIGEAQGPLVYYPGSHRWPIYRNEHVGHVYRPDASTGQHTYEPAWERLVELYGVEPEYFYPRKGQALIWSANLLHGGARQSDPTLSRWSQVTHYYFEDCCYYTPMFSNEPAGDVFLRRPLNIMTGEAVDCRYGGAVVARSSVDQSASLPFDPDAYLARNPDVLAAGADPWRHYLEHGRWERRRWY